MIGYLAQDISKSGPTAPECGYNYLIGDYKLIGKNIYDFTMRAEARE
ncbi:MAG: hypothetical protein HQK49_21765 [Oligoflexia bacterium]|nr:hypothetical protein [Oligoflexia bacterium]